MYDPPPRGWGGHLLIPLPCDGRARLTAADLRRGGVVEPERPGPAARGSRVVGRALPGGGSPSEVEQEPERALGGLRVEPVPPAAPGRHRRSHRARVEQPLALAHVERDAGPDRLAP